MNISCVCYAAGGTQFSLTQCARFRLLRDRYQPYASLDITLDAGSYTALPVRVRFFLNGSLLHDGFVRHAAYTLENGGRLLRIQTRSFTAVLAGNEIMPGLQYDVTLTSLMTTYNLPHITYQKGMAPISYVYFKDNVSMWNAVTAYTYMVCGGYPYVRTANHLCAAPQTGTDPVFLPVNAVLLKSDGCNATELISRMEMADLEGEYGTFSAVNSEAAAREITNVRQMSFDRMFSSMPQSAPQFRIKCSNRRLREKKIRYLGYCGEDLEDLVSCGTLTARVSKIDLSGSAEGLVTEDTFYFDSFCNT